ncbi:hypothetical protein [Desulfosporosinus fructosivorans]
MDHETREMFSNIIGLLEIMKKDIKVIKQDIHTINSRQEVPNLLNRGMEVTRQPSKALEGKKSTCPMLSDQLKISRLR